MFLSTSLSLRRGPRDENIKPRLRNTSVGLWYPCKSRRGITTPYEQTFHEGGPSRPVWDAKLSLSTSTFLVQCKVKTYSVQIHRIEGGGNPKISVNYVWHSHKVVVGILLQTGYRFSNSKVFGLRAPSRVRKTIDRVKLAHTVYAIVPVQQNTGGRGQGGVGKVGYRLLTRCQQRFSFRGCNRIEKYCNLWSNSVFRWLLDIVGRRKGRGSGICLYRQGSSMRWWWISRHRSRDNPSVYQSMETWNLTWK